MREGIRFVQEVTEDFAPEKGNVLNSGQGNVVTAGGRGRGEGIDQVKGWTGYGEEAV